MKKLECLTVGFKDLEYIDSAYQALTCVSNGIIYFGLCTHDSKNHAVFLSYDPITKQIEKIADMGIVTNEARKNRYPQGKLHTKFCEDNKKLYFATHVGYPQGVVQEVDYPGGHWVSYDLKTKVFSDLGIGMAGQGILTMTMDPLYKRLYGLVYPAGDFLIYDILKKRTSTLGPIFQNSTICRTLVVDDQGNVFGSREPDRIFKYDPRTNKLDDIPTKIPSIELGKERGEKIADGTVSRGIWRTAIWDAKTGKFYCIHSGTSMLFSFDPKSLYIEKIGQICPKEFIGNETQTYASLALTLGKNNKLYYAAPYGIFDYFGSRNISDATHLITYDIDSNDIVDHGPLIDDEGHRVLGAQSATVGLDGTIYFLGGVELATNIRLTNDLRKVCGIPYEMKFVICEPV